MTDRSEGLKALGQRLAAWRAAQVGEDGKKLSQSAAAKKIDASQGAWACWELGKKAPDAYFAAEIETLTAGELQVLASEWVFRRVGARTDSDKVDDHVVIDPASVATG